jgi:phage terminase large subunit
MPQQIVKFSELCHFLPRQLEAEEAVKTHKYVLYGGSRGPGKSHWLRWMSIKNLCRLAKEGIKNPVGGLFCEDYPSLKDRHIGKLSTDVPEWLGSIRDSKEYGLAYHIYPAYGGGVLKLRNLDDPSKYQSSEFAQIAVDELTKNQLDTFNTLRGSLRWPGVAEPKFFAATNPGSIGHLWVRAYWIDGDFPAEMQSVKHQFKYVRALPADNPYLSQDYWDMLNSLPPDLARAWRDGDWDVFEGQFFGNLRRDIHGFTGDWPKGRIIRAMDYGEAAPAAVYWATVDHDNDVWIYRELYGAGMQYLTLKERINDLSIGEENAPIFASPDIFAKSKGTGVVGSEIFNSNVPEYGGYNVPVVRADNNRIEGWRTMKLWISTGRLHVHLDNCPNFWRTAPAMVYDSLHPEDMDGKGEDHACEAVRYMLMSRPKPVIRTIDTTPQFSPKAIEAMWGIG